MSASVVRFREDSGLFRVLASKFGCFYVPSTQCRACAAPTHAGMWRFRCPPALEDNALQIQRLGGGNSPAVWVFREDVIDVDLSAARKAAQSEFFAFDAGVLQAAADSPAGCHHAACMCCP